MPLLLSFLIASASGSLTTDVQNLLPILENVQLQQDYEERDAALESRDDLFPVSGSGSSSTRSADRSRAGTSRNSSISSHIIFQWNGAAYVFTDVPVIAWFAPFVRDVAERGIVSGYRDPKGIPTGIFGPERNVTVEELAKIAVEAGDINVAACGEGVTDTSWSAPYIACARSHAFAVYGDGTVDLHRPATRAEVVMTVLQAFGVSLRESLSPGMALKDVTDSTLFSSAIFTAYADRIVSGETDASGNPTGYFFPERPVNRAEVAKIVSLALQVYGK